MSRIFLSHSSANNAAAVALRDWLAAQGWNELFLDLDPDSGIHPGERWERALHDAANRCEAVLFLVSRAWLGSDWCLREFDLAYRLNKKLFGLLIEDIPLADLPSRLTSVWQQVNLAAGQDHRRVTVVMPVTHKEEYVYFSQEALARLAHGLRKAGLDALFFAWPPPSDPDRPPYRGLKPLESEDAGIFFGRDAQIVAALDQLRGIRETSPPRLFVVLGASGAGKSSFLRAGLLPRLARDDRNFLPLPVIRPERGAIGGASGLVRSLETALAAHDPTVSRADVRRAVESGSAGVARLLAPVVERACAALVSEDAGARRPLLVLPIDQGEELFQAEAAAESERFLALVRELLVADAPPIMALVAIRSEFYESLQTTPHLAGVPHHTFGLQPMLLGAYQTVIRGPAARLENTPRAFTIEPALVDALLSDIERGAGRDALPLLAFTLEQLYAEYGRRGRLALADYDALGRIRGSIERAVAQAFASADRDPRVPRDHAARLALLRRGLIPWLAGIDPDTGSPRRRVARQAEIPAEARPLIDHLVEERLLTRDVDAATGDHTIEPAHEALLRQWGLLKGWLDEDFAALSTLERVRDAARDWSANGEDAAWLVHEGERLEDAEAVAAREDLAGGLDATDRRYLALCRDKANRARAAEEEHRRRQQEAQEQRIRDAEALAAADRRTAKRTMAAAAVVAVLAVAAFFLYFAAEAARVEAQKQRDEAARAQAAAERAQQTAERAARDLLIQADQARSEELKEALNRSYEAETAFDYAPGPLRAYFQSGRARAMSRLGDFSGALRQYDRLLREHPERVDARRSRAYLRILFGDADGAADDARQAANSGLAWYGVWLNLAMAEAMRGDLAAARTALEQSIAGFKLPESVIDYYVTPDIVATTRRRMLSLTDSDFLVALRYGRALFAAMAGDADFEAVLEEADRADSSYPQTIGAYLVVINWAWLVSRASGADPVATASGAPGDAAVPRTTTRDYGVHVATGAFWERAAASDARYFGRARQHYERFAAIHAMRTRAGTADGRYAALAAFATRRLADRRVAEAEPILDQPDPRALALAAYEIDQQGSANPHMRAIALTLLTEAIDLYGKGRVDTLARLDADHLVTVLLRRAELRLKAEDMIGARADADEVIRLHPRATDAYKVRAKTWRDPAARAADWRAALEHEPRDREALRELARTIAPDDPREALRLLLLRGRLGQLWGNDHQEIAQLQRRLGLLDDAHQSISNAIALTPWILARYDLRRDIEVERDRNPARADARRIADIRAAAEFQARTGLPAKAMHYYLRALRIALETKPPVADEIAVEAAATRRSLSQFLTDSYGSAYAAKFWAAIAADPTLSRWGDLANKEHSQLAPSR